MGKHIFSRLFASLLGNVLMINEAKWFCVIYRLRIWYCGLVFNLISVLIIYLCSFAPYSSKDPTNDNQQASRNTKR